MRSWFAGLATALLFTSVWTVSPCLAAMATKKASPPGTAPAETTAPANKPAPVAEPPPPAAKGSPSAAPQAAPAPAAPQGPPEDKTPYVGKVVMVQGDEIVAEIAGGAKVGERFAVHEENSKKKGELTAQMALEKGVYLLSPSKGRKPDTGDRLSRVAK